MTTPNVKDIILKIPALIVCFFFIAEHYFFEIEPCAASPLFVLSFLALIAINVLTKSFQRKNYFRSSHIAIVVASLFLVVHFRAGTFWALNTFPLRDANTVWLTLQEPFDDFAYSMDHQYLTTTIPQALIITVILALFIYTVLSSTKTRLVSIAAYFVATILLLISEIPISDYFHYLNNEPEKNTALSEFFAENYVNPDSVKITPPEQKRNLILIYIESLETTFSDKNHGGNQDTNLIPEITKIAQQNINFGRNKNHIGGGIDATGSASTFGAMHTRSLGIPHIANYKKTPILHHYKSIYDILNNNGYKQLFFQGNSGLYNDFRDFVIDHKINEVYGPEDLIQRLRLDTLSRIRNQRFKTVPDKEVFKFANQILDTISEPFSLTFFTIDTHAPNGLYDPDCIKASDESNEDEQLKAAAQCVSRELNKFITTVKSRPFYENTTIVVFGDHLFMGTRLVKDFPDRKWINIFINSPKSPISEEDRIFSDIDMLPTILSSINFSIEGDRLGFGTNLFSDKKTLIEQIGLDSLNKEINNMPSHLIYESYMLKKQGKEQ